jgi:hypothetical protein
VKIGQTMAYSGPASSFATVGHAMTAYFHNAEGGVNGRKINLISLDDSYSPPKTVEQTRRLVESGEVLAIVGTFGSPTNLAIQKYLNGKRCRPDPRRARDCLHHGFRSHRHSLCRRRSRSSPSLSLQIRTTSTCAHRPVRARCN